MHKKFKTNKIDIDLEIYDSLHYYAPSKTRTLPLAKLYPVEEDIER
jgi:hypothetical protein